METLVVNETEFFSMECTGYSVLLPIIHSRTQAPCIVECLTQTPNPFAVFLKGATRTNRVWLVEIQRF